MKPLVAGLVGALGGAAVTLVAVKSIHGSAGPMHQYPPPDTTGVTRPPELTGTGREVLTKIGAVEDPYRFPIVYSWYVARAERAWPLYTMDGGGLALSFDCGLDIDPKTGELTVGPKNSKKEVKLSGPQRIWGISESGEVNEPNLGIDARFIVVRTADFWFILDRRDELFSHVYAGTADELMPEVPADRLRLLEALFEKPAGFDSMKKREPGK
jgi:hypothetical protein